MGATSWRFMIEQYGIEELILESESSGVQVPKEQYDDDRTATKAPQLTLPLLISISMLRGFFVPLYLQSLLRAFCTCHGECGNGRNHGGEISRRQGLSCFRPFLILTEQSKNRSILRTFRPVIDNLDCLTV